MQDQTPQTTHPFRRFLFGIICFCLWIVVIYLALEAFTTIQLTLVYTYNPYYLAIHKSKNTLPSPPLDPLQQPLSIEKTSLTWDTTTPKPPFATDWEIPPKNETEDQKRTRRILFPALSEEERTRFAISNAEMVMMFDENGNLQEAYDDCFKRYLVLHNRYDVADLVRDKVQAIAHSKQPQTIQLNPRFSEKDLGPMDFFFLPTSNNVYVFFEFELRRLLAVNPDIPQSSRWKIIDYSYKENFKNPTSDSNSSFNHYGFRSNDVTVPKPKGTFRILCIGGSTTYEGATNESTYPALLEKKLRAAYPGKQIEVINCGIQGLRTRTQFLHVPNYLELEPDLIIGYLGVNDIQHDVQDILNAEAPEWITDLNNSTFFRYNLADIFRPDDKTIQHWLQALTITNIDELHRIFARKGIHFTLCSLTYAPQPQSTKAQIRFFNTTCDMTAEFFARLARLLNTEIHTYCEQHQLLYIPVAENITCNDFLVDTCHLHEHAIPLKAKIVFESIKNYIAPALTNLEP